MNRTKIHEHKQTEKKLVPPLAQLGFTNSSWQNERLPHMLWAAVLAGNLPRERALQIFRRVAEECVKMPDTVYPDVSHFGLAQMPSANAKQLISAVATTREITELLSSILIYDELPAKAEWAEVLGAIKCSDPETVLMKAVECTLWHQTQEATDCRWCRILPPILTGRTKGIPDKLFRQLVNYPLEGEMTSVRPTIRAKEMAMAAFEAHIGQTEKRARWASAFWAQNLRDFPCFGLLRDENLGVKPGTTLSRVDEVYSKLIEHNIRTCTYTGIDARHDTTFGFALYSLTIVRELLAVGNYDSILGRLGLRTLLDCFVTLAYLIQKE